MKEFLAVIAVLATSAMDLWQLPAQCMAIRDLSAQQGCGA